MAAPHSVDPVQLLEKHLASASPDLPREMVAAFAKCDDVGAGRPGVWLILASALPRMAGAEVAATNGTI